MLLDEDPAAVCQPSLISCDRDTSCSKILTVFSIQLIHECIGNFNITPDRSALARINESLSTLNQSRELRLTDATTSLKRVTRQLQTLDQQHNYNLSSQNPTEHAAQILALDSQKFKVAKEASDLEIEGEKLENELASLETQLRDLQTQDSNWGMGNGEEQDV